ncbi:MAG: hypothetical protein JNK74_06890 [Candidatus Hydrogenedentes bacterium]|nr:hypothetical protein [Candidatus Hydrogenedentota bacterium]
MTTPLITIDISDSERDAILNHVPLPANIVARLRFALRTMKSLELTLSGDDVIDLAEAIEEHLPRIKKRADAREVEAVFVRLVDMIHEEYVQAGGPAEELDFPPDMPEAVREAVQQVFDSGDYETPQELMGALKKAVVEADDTRYERLFGLTTGEVLNLIGEDWTEPGGVFWIDDEIPKEQLAGSRYCMNAFRFLALAKSTGGFKLTPKKRLNRASVRFLLDSDCFPEVDVAQMLRYSSVINEMDVQPLHMVHLLLLEIGFVRHYKGTLVVTKKGLQALEDDGAGTLQRLMFQSLYNEFDLAYLDTLPDYPGVQATIPFIFYAIQQSAQEPVAAGDLMAKAYTPAVAAEFSEGPYPRHALVTFFTRVLRPMEDFGLVQHTRIGNKHERDLARDLVQVTPLFNAMLHFDLKRS